MSASSENPITPGPQPAPPKSKSSDSEKSSSLLDTLQDGAGMEIAGGRNSSRTSGETRSSPA